MMDSFFSQHLPSHFEEIRPLRESGEKRISLIRHRGSGSRFVLRTLPEDLSCYRRLLGVKCPHLPQIFEVTEDRLVLEEYVEGDPLFDVIQRGPLSESETRHISRDLCHALYVLHSLDIIHRDVKPENVILRGSDAVLMDLDSARILQRNAQSPVAAAADTRLLGTVGYAPPEQYGLRQTDPRSDIFALGVTMNMMITGTHPSVQTAGGRLGHIISRCTMMQPERRYPDILHLMQALS